VVGFEQRGRRRKGVGSTHLADRVVKDTCLPVYIQKAHGFHLPANPETPIVMIGPGTGIAPFRAFLEERAATGAKGRNWLFFGNPKRATDFLYENQLTSWAEQGFLTRLDTAFSRDQAQKIYVQDRIREAGAELWSWLSSGAHLYICGDAKRMARDVDQALTDIIAQHGGMDAAAAKAWLAKLGRDGRYQRDVY
jgi:sulfite reductase (NADPH) flavoprotein alpha-component